MKTAHLAESFGVQCELHTTIYHPLEVVNLHCSCAISNCEFFELLYPLTYMEFGMKNKLDIDAEGYARPPQRPGIGVLTGTSLTTAPFKRGKEVTNIGRLIA
jgi:L-alanine-DL-glutamate epimerase-like enolase superfamily enzyme